MSTAASSTVEKEQHLYKVVFLGDYACGKTSLIRRYVEGTFTPNYKLTIGVDFAVKNVEWNDSTTVSLQLWDVAGHERFGCMTSVYYKYAIAAIIVYDLSRPSTFDPVLKWRDDLNSKVVLSNDEPVPVVLLANKVWDEAVYILPLYFLNCDDVDVFSFLFYPCNACNS
eukprot:TRINITY_DN3264_c0_g2_i2.p1 TRINITY_DN3264_c0_g2~~TRINITY_DN3264_c0_g2_i2.p1  ORF type:complete len:169 (-),score=37.53 TRINITY_DN3264_c0_g2_i2:37-543(-)